MVVVTGATGHIGNTLVRALLAQGEKVRCLVLPGDDLRPLKGLDVEVIEGDVRHREVLDRVCRGARVVYHLASVIALVPRSAGLLYEVNVGGTRNVVEACLACGVERLARHRAADDGVAGRDNRGTGAAAVSSDLGGPTSGGGCFPVGGGHRGTAAHQPGVPRRAEEQLVHLARQGHTGTRLPPASPPGEPG